MVFQSFNLFPHMTVLRNVALGPARVRGLSWTDADERARKLLVRVGSKTTSPNIPHNCPAGSSSASGSPGRLPWNQRCFFSTSRLRL